jgi:hypothetical protein
VPGTLINEFPKMKMDERKTESEKQKNEETEQKKKIGTITMICLLRPGVTATVIQLSTKLIRLVYINPYPANVENMVSF